MKPYETGICSVCRQPKNDHYKKCEEHEQPGGCKLPNVHCQWPLCVSPLGHDFIDSGTAQLCSEEVASGLLRELQNARELINKQHCTGKVSAKEEIDTMSNIDKAINEALKRGDSRS